ncbi:MAG: hypothetical protein AVDCRST_MAG93-4460, partial [uncultured Chloroflexia bacterium]
CSCPASGPRTDRRAWVLRRLSRDTKTPRLPVGWWG